MLNFKNFELIENFGGYFIVEYENMFGFSDNDNLLFPFLILSYKIISEEIIIVKYQNIGFCVFDENLDLIIEPNAYSSIEIIGNDLSIS